MGWEEGPETYKPLGTGAQVKGDEVGPRAGAVGMKGRSRLEKYLVDAKGFILAGDEKVLELHCGDVCTTL